MLIFTLKFTCELGRMKFTVIIFVVVEMTFFVHIEQFREALYLDGLLVHSEQIEPNCLLFQLGVN